MVDRDGGDTSATTLTAQSPRGRPMAPIGETKTEQVSDRNCSSLELQVIDQEKTLSCTMRPIDTFLFTLSQHKTHMLSPVL